MEMMSQFMGQEMDGCDCADMISQFTSKQTDPDIKRMMSKMESCCGFRTEEESVSK
jgi:hypothetical protein